MHFKLPQLHHLVNDNKKIGSDNPSKYVHVLKGHAFVSHQLVAVVNLREYIKAECEVEDKEELAELEHILDWMEGKSFTKEFWSQLVKEQEVSRDNDSLLVEDASFTSYLHYQSVEVDLRQPMKVISSNINIPEFSLWRVSFNGYHLELLQKAFKNELKRDQLNFEFSETSKPAKFSLSQRNYIFGAINSTMNAASELMAFLGNADFKAVVDEHLNSLLPLPPKEEIENFDSELVQAGASHFDPGDDTPGLFD